MRKKNRKGKVGVDEGEKLLEWQLKGLGEEEVREGGSRIVRVDKGKGKGKELLPSAPAAGMEVGGHINFWSEMETGVSSFRAWRWRELMRVRLQGQIGGVNVEAALEKALQKEQEESITKVYLAKRGEGDQKGWYASQDGKTERERKEGVEGGLERAYVLSSPASRLELTPSRQVQRRRGEASLRPNGAHELVSPTARGRPLRRSHSSSPTLNRPRTVPHRHSPLRPQRPLPHHHLPPGSPPSQRRSHPRSSSPETHSNPLPLFIDERSSERSCLEGLERTSEGSGVDRFETDGFGVVGGV